MVASARFPFTERFLPLCLDFVDKAAQGFGFGGKETAGILLAAEELYAYYSAHAGLDSDIELVLQDEGYRLLFGISFSLADPDMRALNLAFNIDLDDEDALDMLGPMIAARSVSGLRLDFGPEEQVTLKVWREKEYPFSDPLSFVSGPKTGPMEISIPSPEDLRHFSSMVAATDGEFTPEFLLKGGMAAEMLKKGALQAAVIQTGADILGGVVWQGLTDACIEVFGPYVFAEDPDDEILTQLMDQAISAISRTPARGILRRQSEMKDFQRFFDFLGVIQVVSPQGEPTGCFYYFRQLKEESSSYVYSSSGFAKFLEREYDRLYLPRRIRTTDFASMGQRDYSVIAVEFKNGRTLAHLRPLCAGRDLVENLEAHIALLKSQDVKNIFFEIDTGREEEMMFTSALQEVGFQPVLVIPDAAVSDLVIFSYLTDGMQ